ncbi:hypothetical protein [Halodesulfovibrio sp.]|uniref:hypothetical protein n=1 Tax=Halodesulfovibrio sp. TaxID=1912772 RepID=UPI0025BB1D92|nr:hypothetical protein [Halodesulfovibrio sp.]
MIDPLNDFDTEKVTVITNGNEQKGIECLWDDESILFRANDVLIDFDSTIKRSYPAGEVEYRVTDPGYTPQQMHFIAMYSPKVTRLSHAEQTASKHSGVFHVNTVVMNNNARLNISSTDQSTNIQQQSSQLDELRQALCSQVDDSILKIDLLNLLETAEKSEDTEVKKQAVDSFLTKSANIMTIVSPFISNITGLLS